MIIKWQKNVHFFWSLKKLNILSYEVFASLNLCIWSAFIHSLILSLAYSANVFYHLLCATYIYEY
jgi:hypothetical protein